MWEAWNRLYSNKKGQALLELAIFGSIILMLLGIILNYGLRYNFQQRTTMSAFRKALQASTNPNAGGQASFALIQDRHIPNPTDPFAVGSVMPSVSGASVIRSSRLHETADIADELPKTTIQIQDRQFTYKTAGFRDEYIEPENVDKYKEIYGMSVPDVSVAGTYKIIDFSEGEIVSLESAVRQCRQIVDEEVCEKECERGKLPGSDKDCNDVCSQTMNVPWYCQGYKEIDTTTHKYTFPNLDLLFVQTTMHKQMGLQQPEIKTTTINNILTKQESEGTITTTDTINWSNTTDRTIIINEHLNADGTAQPTINIQEVPVSTTVGENRTCVNAECN